MPFVKVLKNKQYFKRYQTKFRRRREGKTDYRARKRMVAQDKNKYNTPKYRLVVRFTNRYCIAQIVYATIDGDKVLAAANSKELARYGLKVGLKNYAAAYCTGLLIARRILNKLGLDEAYEGVDEPDGEIPTTKDENNGRTYYVPELNDEKKPFRCILDVGIQTTTTGNRVFGVLKGASDGGLDIPQSEKRFPGYDRDGKRYDADSHKERIMGEHVAEYINYLVEEDHEAYERQFANYIKHGVSGDDYEEVLEKVHAAIREDPTAAPKEEWSGDRAKYKRQIKLTYEERKARVAEKKAALAAAAGAGDEMEEDDDE